MKWILLLLFCGIAYGAPAGEGLCEVCHLLVGEVQDLVTRGETQESIKGYVVEACAKLPSEEKDVCHMFMDANSGVLFQHLIADLTPHEFCGKLTEVCAPVEQEEPEEAVEVEEDENQVEGILECELCKLAVLGIDKLIKDNNRSSAVINATLEKFCDSLPAEISSLCKRIEPDILNGLTQGFDPKVACHFAKLCTVAHTLEIKTISCDICHTAMDALGITDTGSICVPDATCNDVEKVEESVKEEQVELQDTFECQLCKFLVQAIDNLVGENKSIAAINSTLTAFCNDLPGELKDTCLNVEPDILKAILGGIDPSKSCDFVKACQGEVPVSSKYIPCSICKNTMERLAGEAGVKICYQFEEMCPPEEAEPVVTKETIETPPCDICQFLHKSVNDLITRDMSRDQVAELVDAVCSNMPVEGRAFCSEYEEQIIEAAFEFAGHPMAQCRRMQVCADNEKEFTPAVIERKVPVGDAKCDICKFVIQILDQYVEKNASVEKINATLFQLCNDLPRSYQEVCFSIIPQIEKVIESGLDPDASCKKLNLCTDIVQEPSQAIQKSDEPVGDAKCDICKFVIQILDQYVEKNASVEKINATLFQLCNDLPRSYQEVCFSIIPQIENVIESGLDPDASCKKINLCTDIVQEPSRAITKTDEPVGDAKCELCEFVVQLLDQYVEKNSTIEKINTTLYQLCNDLPQSYQAVCLSIVPQIEKVVESGLDPTASCTQINFCTSFEAVVPIDVVICKACSSLIEREEDEEIADLVRENVCSNCPHRAKRSADTMMMQIAQRFKDGNLGGEVECAACKAMISALDALVGENATLDKINKTATEICERLTGIQLQTMCLHELPTLVKILHEGLDPDKTCVQAKLCQDVVETQPEVLTRSRRAVKIAPIENVGDLKCDLCKEVITVLDEFVEKNATDEKINQTIYMLCNGLPAGALRDLCLSEAPAILDAIKTGIDPEKGCEEVKLCSSTDMRPLVQKLANGISKHKNHKNVGDLKCDLCKDLIIVIDEFVGKNATDEKINQTLYMLCNSLPGDLKDLCVQEAPNILKALEAGFDPDKACSSVKLCAIKKIRQLFQKLDGEKLKKNRNNLGDLKCDLCKDLIIVIDEFVGKNATDEKINQTLYMLCNSLPGDLKDLCVQEAPNILKALEAGFDPDKACSSVKLCAIKTEIRQLFQKLDGEKLKKNRNNLGDLKCDLCKDLVIVIDEFVGKNATDEKINQTLYMLCNSLPGDLKDLCLQEAPNIMKALEAGFDPDKACSTVNLCALKRRMSPLIRKLVQQKPIDEVVIDKKEKTNNNIKGLKCELCKAIIDELDSVLEKNGTVEAINNTVYGFCMKLEGAIQDICLNAAPFVVSAVGSGVDPDTVCLKIGFCSSTTDNLYQPVPSNDIKCELCELIILKVDTLIGKNSSSEKINKTVYTVCDDLSGTIQAFCYLVAPTVVNELNKGGEPNQVCVAVKLCSHPNNTLSEPVGDIKCEICELIIQGLDELVGKNASDEKINATIFNLCNSLSGSAISFCVLVAPTIVKEIEGGADPQKACTALKLCSSSDVYIADDEELKDVKCDICELIIQGIDTLVGTNTSEAKINATVNNLCNDLPGTIKDLCKTLAPTIVQAIVKGADPQKTCATLKLCTSVDFVIPEEMVIDIPPASERKNQLECGTCIQSLAAVYQDVSNDYLKVQRTLQRLCNNLPIIFREQCHDLVSSDSGRFLKTVLGNYTPILLCEMAKCQESGDYMPLKNLS